MYILYWIFVPLFIFFSVVMILLVLIQKGRGGGISGAFGGGGGGNTAFGAKTGDVLTWATSIVFALFVILAVVLNLICDKMGAAPTPQQQQTQQVPVGGPMSSSNTGK
jgi:preprotein translocase subunit SecG